MRYSLAPHPGEPCQAVRTIEVEVRRAGPGVLNLRYELSGALSGLRLPAPASQGRADALWRTTCFEAFLRAPGDEAYVELNLAPSGQWAAYGFTGYREGMAPLDLPRPPGVRLEHAGPALALSAELRLDGVAALPSEG